MAHAQVQPQCAVTLLAAAQALREVLGLQRASCERADYERELTASRAALGEEAFGASWTQGQAMTLEQAIEYALAEA